MTDAWSLSNGAHGVRLVTFTCPGCRCVTSWESSNGINVALLTARCCATGKTFSYPAHVEKFANFVKERRATDSDCGGVSYIGSRR